MKSKLRILCLFLLIHTTGNAQDTDVEFCPMGEDSTTQQKMSTMSISSTTLLNDGIHITAHGQLKVPVIFIRFPGDDLELGTWWPKNDDPIILNSIIDPSTNSNSTNKYNLTNFFDVMSVRNFDVIGEAISVVAPNPVEYYDSTLGLASKDILKYVSDNNLIDFSNYDNWTTTAEGTHINTSDGLVDLVVLVWKGESFVQHGNFGGCAALYRISGCTFGQILSEPNPGILNVNNGKTVKFGLGAMEGSGVTVFAYASSEKNLFYTIVHEIGHWLLGTGHPFPSNSNSPTDRTASRLGVGEIITHVNGMEIEEGTNFYSYFVNETSEQVLLEVRNGRDSREVVIRPTNSLGDELYEEWIDSREKLTAEYSNGRLGYIHIEGMNWPSFERFERELTAQGYGKEGVVIDVRWNGGGWTTDYLMTVLNVRQHAYTIPRGATNNLDGDHSEFVNYYPYSERLPLSWWTKPSVALSNESSYSNAEIFSHAYKTLGVGTLVGMPTFGAVISTGSTGLIDGSRVRMPFRGWYVSATGENMENGPAVPDVLINNEPDSKAKGEDPQLKKAVEVLLEQIDE